MEENKKYKVLAGLYLMEEKRYCTYFLPPKDRYLTADDTTKGLWKKPFKAGHTGMGFMLVRYGVFEKLTYPWFYPTSHKEKGGATVISADYVSFCERVKNEANIDIWVDPKVIVGHEETIVLK